MTDVYVGGGDSAPFSAAGFALTCSYRGCGQPLTLATKKRNRDRRPTYQCSAGHNRKTCPDCGKQGEAKNFSRHVCKPKKRRNAERNPRPLRRARPPAGSMTSSDDSDDSRSVTSIDSDTSSQSGGTGGSHLHVTTMRGSGTGSMNSYMTPISEHGVLDLADDAALNDLLNGLPLDMDELDMMPAGNDSWVPSPSALGGVNCQVDSSDSKYMQMNSDLSPGVGGDAAQDDLDMLLGMGLDDVPDVLMDVHAMSSSGTSNSSGRSTGSPQSTVFPSAGPRRVNRPGKSPHDSPVLPTHLQARSHNERAVQAAMGQPFVKVEHRAGAGGAGAGSGQRDGSDIDLESGTLDELGALLDHEAGSGKPDEALPLLDWMRGRVSVYMGMFFVFYAVTFVLQAGLFGVDATAAEVASPAMPQAHAAPTPLDVQPLSTGYGGGVRGSDTAHPESLGDVVGAAAFADGEAGEAADAGNAPDDEYMEPASASAAVQPKSSRTAPAQKQPQPESDAAGGMGGHGAAPMADAQQASASAEGVATVSQETIIALATSAVVALLLSTTVIVLYRYRSTVFARCRRNQASFQRLPMVRTM